VDVCRRGGRDFKSVLDFIGKEEDSFGWSGAELASVSLKWREKWRETRKDHTLGQGTAPRSHR